MHWLAVLLMAFSACVFKAPEKEPVVGHLFHWWGLMHLPNHQYSQDYPVHYTQLCNRITIRNQGGVGSCVAFGLSYVISEFAGFEVSPAWIYGHSHFRYQNKWEYVGSVEWSTQVAASRYPVSYQELPYRENTKKWWELKVTPDSRPGIIYKYQEVPHTQMDYLRLNLSRGKPMIVQLLFTDDLRRLKYGEKVGPSWGRFERHVVTLCGYTSDSFIIANSWGRDWGTDGFFEMPYSEWNVRKPIVVEIVPR